MANPFLLGNSLLRSMNRAHIVDLPGIQVDEGVLGKSGYLLLSAKALREEALAAQEELQLNPHAPDILIEYDRGFYDPAACQRAKAIARAYGRRVGYLLLMLVRGDACNRQARPEWTDAHWNYWKGIRKVWLGGGMLSGNMGPYAVEAANQLLSENSLYSLELALSPYAAVLPLVGLARSAPPEAAAMVVLDFGQTSVKRGIARYQDGQLAWLRLLPSAPTVCESLYQPEYPVEEVRERWRRMLNSIIECWNLAAPEIPSAVGMCLSCYLIDGHPADEDLGCYSSLRLLGPNLESFIREELRENFGLPLNLALLHDGAAAATAYASASYQEQFVITLGTAIGNGFPPPDSECWPLAPGFHII